MNRDWGPCPRSPNGAICARDCQAVEAHGPYAHVNLPDEWPAERRAAVMEAVRLRTLAHLTELRERLAATRDAPLS